MSTTYSTSSSTTNSGSTTTSTSKTAATGKVSDVTQQNFNKYNTDYKEGQSVKTAYSQLQNTLANQPGAFQSTYKDQLDTIYSNIMDRQPFKYDLNSDALYNTYKDQYITAGRNAMQDTIGQASAMTGGYGNTYAQTAGQQTYQGYLQQLNSNLLDFYDRAKGAYDTETNNLYNQYSAAGQAYSRDYGEYNDNYNRWSNDRDYYQSAYESERNFDYGKFSDNRSYWNSEYWNEKNSESTTTSRSDTSSWSTTNSTSSSTTASSGSSGGSSKSKTSINNGKVVTTQSGTGDKYVMTMGSGNNGSYGGTTTFKKV